VGSEVVGLEVGTAVGCEVGLTVGDTLVGAVVGGIVQPLHVYEHCEKNVLWLQRPKPVPCTQKLPSWASKIEQDGAWVGATVGAAVGVAVVGTIVGTAVGDEVQPLQV